MPRQHADFDKHYGPLLDKWSKRLGHETLKELEADLQPAIQSLLREDAAEIHQNGGHHHAQCLHDSIDNYESWKKTKGF